MSASRPLVVERLPRRASAPPTAPLPEPVLTALAAIVRDMRDVPRDCFRDPAEMLFWLRRMARRVEGVERMRVPAVPPRPSGLSRLLATPRAVPSARQTAEAVFGIAASTVQPGPGDAFSRTGANKTRTVTSRKGRVVPVEIRRARAGGQLELRV